MFAQLLSGLLVWDTSRLGMGRLGMGSCSSIIEGGLVAALILLLPALHPPVLELGEALIPLLLAHSTNR